MDKVFLINKKLFLTLFLLIVTAGMTIGEAQTPTGAINGLFSVSETQLVYFSKGNLQYKASTNTWQFADKQYTYIGSSNSNISSTYSNYIDLFGWGTSGYNHGATAYQPYSTSTTDTHYFAYGDEDSDLNSSTGKADWGYNAISNGGNQENSGWRTLSDSEWNYLLFSRITSSGVRYAKATVNSIKGVILLPDDWSTSYYSLTNTNTRNAAFTSNSISASNWNTLEQHGAVFLPTAGMRDGTTVSNVGSYGYYWSSKGDIYEPDEGPDRYTAIGLYFYGSNLDVSTFNRTKGNSVRLTKSAPTTIITVSQNPGVGGIVSGAGATGKRGLYLTGTECTLTATANPNYAFVNWTLNGEVVSTNAVYSFTTSGNASLVANYIYTGANITQGMLNGVFTVSDGQQIHFSQGNLQYKGSASTPYWKFADNQWEYLGTTTSQNSDSQNVDRDLFGWGTSGYNHGATAYQPWSTIQSNSDYYAYGNSTYHLYDQTGKADWGYNAISNGGNTENCGWRVLTKEEWSYLFNTRSTTSGIRYAKAQVNSINGIILLPDDWLASYYSLSNTNTSSSSYSGNTITSSQWTTLEQHGAVFLPASGYRSNTSVSNVGSIGYYWSSSYRYANNADDVWFSSSSLSPSDYSPRLYGCAVRLVRPHLNMYGVNASPQPSVGGTVSGTGSYQVGASCTLTANANNGYTFVNWTMNGNVVSTYAAYSFTVLGDVDLVANFTYSGSNLAGVLPGSFTVSSGKQVFFSQGNLQYKQSTSTWRFAENQFDCTRHNGSYGGWFDLFGWGTSGHACNTYYQPWSTNTTGSGYGPSGFYDLTGTYANQDWGVYNAISNGGNQAGLWRTLTESEWNYLLNTRSTSSGIRYAKAQVGGTKGLILLPDDWSTSYYSLTNTNNGNAGFTSNTISYNDWENLERYGVVFLPASSQLSSSSGYYWTASCGIDSEYAYQVYFYDSGVGLVSSADRSNSNSVRLARNSQSGMYSVKTIANPVAGGELYGGGVYQSGDQCVLSAVAYEGYTFTNWKKGNTVVSSNPNYSFTVSSSTAVIYKATFTINSYSISASTSPTAGGSVSGAGSYDHGSTCSLTANAATGYSFVKWTEGDEVVSTDPTYSFTVTGPRALVAHFIINPVITVSTNPTTVGTVSGGGTYSYGASCTLIATPTSDYTFVYWKEGEKVVSSQSTYSFTVTKPRTLVACFCKISEGLLKGSFSVSGIERVRFSKGNLQYQASTNTWKFADKQYNYIGSNNASISQSYSGWIDLFGWGTSGYNHGAVCYQPWSTSTSYSSYYAYGSSTYHLYNQTGKADWGYNAISNGCNTENCGWRVLTKEEWNYLFNTRSTTSGIRYAKAKVNSINGIILLPDDWLASYYSLNNTNTASSSYTDNTITSSQWTTLEQYGAVFLPASGYRNNTSVSNVGSVGYYWSSSYIYTSSAYNVNFSSNTFNSQYSWSRDYGCAVRLVCPAANYPLGISASPNSAGYGMVTGAGLYPEGSECTLTATPSEGYHFVNWTKDGEVVSTDCTYTFTVVQPAAFIANFAINTYNITVSKFPINSGKISGEGVYNHGSTVTLTATDRYGYTFVNWMENGEVVSTNREYSFVVTEDHTLLANFSSPAALTTGAIDGRFSINNAQQVCFSQGNLQYIGSASTPYWKFADNQWDRLSSNSNSSTNVDRDLFCWGTSGYNHGATQYQPWASPDNSTNAYNKFYAYGNYTYNLFDQTGQADWGYNAISNGGNTTDTWRTLTLLEWNYLFNTRTTDSGIRYAKAKVNNVSGVILLPDDWQTSYYTLASVNTSSSDFTSNVITTEQWATLEQHGAVFLPATGYRYSVSSIEESGKLYYWSSTCSSNKYASYLYVQSTSVNFLSEMWRAHGLAVRLVCAAPASSYEIKAQTYPMEGGVVNGTGSFDYGKTCTLTATPDANHSFLNWTENGTVVSADDTYSFVVRKDRNLVANFVVRGGLQGAFSIDANGNKVKFSQGNLQYIGSATTPYWKFAENQWDYLGYSTNQNSSAANVDRDLFGWGTSGYNHGATCYQPWSTSTSFSSYYVYGNSTNNLYNENGQADWGYNAISNGGNLENSGWRTLTKEEWAYLFDTRSTTSGIRFAKAKVNNVNGVILLPDNWSGVYFSLNNTNGSSANYTSNTITATQWTTLEQHGAVFLPAAGYREGTNVYYEGSYGYYWSSSYYNNSVAYSNYFYSTFLTPTFNNKTRDEGCSVRLVIPTQSPAYSINAAPCPTGTGSVSGAGAYLAGTNCTLTATATDGYIFVNWTENGTEVSANATYSFEVTGDRSLVANFVHAYTVTVTANPVEGGEVSGSGIYPVGASCTITATPATGYTFTKWMKNGTQVSTNANYTFTVTEDASFVAIFTINSYAIQASANPAVGGTVSGAGNYNHGTTVSLTATPATGYTFVNWTKDGTEVSTNPTYSFMVTEAGDYVAQFSLNSYEITATANPAVGGEVTGAGTYDHGTTVTLTATVNTGYTFVNWTKDGIEVSVNPAYSFTAFEGGDYTAHFLLNNYAVTVTANPTAGGIVTGGGSFDHGTTATVTATANTGYFFVNWSSNGEVVSNLNSYSFVVTSDCQLVAHFEAITPHWTTPTMTTTMTITGYVMIDGVQQYADYLELGAFCGDECRGTSVPQLVTNGMYLYFMSVAGDTDGELITFKLYDHHLDQELDLYCTCGINYQAEYSTSEYYQFTFVSRVQIATTADPVEGGTLIGAGNYFPGLEATLTATANTGYIFTYWTKDGAVVSTDASYTFTVTEAGIYVAHFGYSITATANPVDGGTMTGTGPYYSSETCTLTATANIGYSFQSWTLNNEVVSTEPEYSFEVSGPAEYVANFSLNNYEITASVNPAESGTVEGSGTYNHFAFCSLTATPATGYHFQNWTLGDEVVSTNAEFTFEVSAAAEYVAHFSPNSYSITAVSSPVEAGTVEGIGTYEHFSTCTLTAVAAEHFTFHCWMLDGVTVSTEAIYSFEVDGSKTLTAVFYLVQEEDMPQGWTWWSTTVELDSIDGLAMLENSLSDAGIIIKTNNTYVQYFPSLNGWMGTLTRLYNEKGYKIQVSRPSQTTMVGPRVNPADHPIAIHYNWNWISYPSVELQYVADALANFTPSENDIIKGQDGYATYIEGMGWLPATFTLEPGNTYLYHSNSSEQKTLTFASGGRAVVAQTDNCHWRGDAYGYPDNLCLMAVVTLDGEELHGENFELGAFVKGECRGSAKLIYIEPIDRYYAMMTITGEDGEQIDFALIDEVSGVASCDSPTHITFVADAVVGMIDEPFIVEFGGLTSIEEYDGRLTLYPNPVGRGETFSLALPEGEELVELTVTNALGAVVRHEEGAIAKRQIMGMTVSGLYIVRAVTCTGKVYQSKLMVK